MAGPGGFDKGPEHTGDERVTAEEQRVLRRCGRVRECCQRALCDLARTEEIRREAVRTRGAPAHVSEENARVEQHAVGELAELPEEPVGADLFVEEAERAPCIAARVAAG